METTIITTPNNPSLIQQVSKASSDQLLSKFAQIDDSDTDPAPSARKSISAKSRRKTSQVKIKRVISIIDENNNYYSCNNNKVVEKKSLLPQHYRDKSSRRGSSSSSSNSGGLLFKHLGVSRSHQIRNGGKDFRTKIVLSAIEKTWTKAIRGATKVFMEKHYNRHRMLINDMV